MLKQSPPSVLSGEILKDEQERLHACYRLRHNYFVLQRGWVEENHDAPGLERDCYDDHALHLSVVNEAGVIAYLRILPFDPVIGFMLDRELSCLLNEWERAELQREDAVELSRLVVRPDVLSPRRGAHDPHPVEKLLKQLYQVSKERHFKHFYIVVEEDWLKPFSRRFGLPFRVIGTGHTFPDGTKTVAAVATIEELEAGMRRHSAAKYAWYQSEND